MPMVGNYCQCRPTGLHAETMRPGYVVAELCKDRHGGAARTPGCSQHLMAATQEQIIEH